MRCLGIYKWLQNADYVDVQCAHTRTFTVQDVDRIVGVNGFKNNHFYKTQMKKNICNIFFIEVHNN